MSDYSCIEVQRQSGVFNIGFVQRSFRTCKPKEVLVKSLYSSINYKDYLVLQGNPSLVRKFPRVPGTDVAGIVVDSCNPNIPVGSYVISTCFPLGSSIDGGFSEYVLFSCILILEGVIEREDALSRVEFENQPRLNMIKEYCELIDVDYDFVIERLDDFKKASKVKKWKQ